MALLERQLQLDALDEYAADVRRGEGRLALVSGEAGVGKSALLEEFERRLGDARWSWGVCDGLSTPRPLGPLLDIAAGLGGPLQEAVGAGRSREEIFQALLTEATACRPQAVLVFEDVHWADEATLDLLRFMGRRIRRTPVLLLVTYRDDEIPGGHPLRTCLSQLAPEPGTRRIDVPRLTPAAVRVLAEGSGLEPDEVHHLTGGNPYYVTEVVRSAGSGVLPASALDAVLGRMDALSEPARRALDAAALIGARVDLDLLGQITPTPMDALDELLDTGLLVPDGTGLRFRHEITRLAVERGIAPHRSAPLHAQILALLRRRDCEDDARLAHHAEGAADAAAVLLHATLAARRATALAAHREAAAQYERALRWAGPADGRDRAIALDALSDEYGVLDRWESALEARERALALWRELGDRVREADSLRLLSRCLWRLCRGREAAAASDAALEILLPLGPSEELARALAAVASQCMVQGADEDAVAHADRAVEMAEHLDLRDVVSDALNTRGCARFNQGHSDWQATLQQCLAVALDGGGDEAAGRAYANLHSLCSASLRFAEADRTFREAMDYCEGHDLPTFANCLAGEQAVMLEVMGRWDESARICRERLAVPHLSPVNKLSTYLALGRVTARRGEAEAWEHLDTALAGAESIAEAQYLVPVRLARGEAHWIAGDLEPAVREVAQAAALVDRVDRVTRGQAALWAARVGLEPPGDDLGDPFATHLRGDAADAARAWDTLGCPYDAALALLDGPAEEHWRDALVRLVALGADATADVARRRLRQAGARVPTGARATTRSHPCGLTRREQEVLEQLAQGRTNDEIAAVLFISAKTVDHHVSAVLAKLGVANRREAGARAVRLGLHTQDGEAVAAT